MKEDVILELTREEAQSLQSLLYYALENIAMRPDNLVLREEIARKLEEALV